MKGHACWKPKALCGTLGLSPVSSLNGQRGVVVTELAAQAGAELSSRSCDPFRTAHSTIVTQLGYS